MNLRQWVLCVLCILLFAGGAIAQSTTEPSLVDMDGKSTSLDLYKGKVVLVNFWATWCAPCLQEMPELNHASQQLNSKQSAILGVAADSYDNVKAFVEAQGILYPIAVGDPDQIFGWSASLGNISAGLPFSVLLDTEGNVVWKHEGGALTSEQVLDLINQELAVTE